MLLTGMVNVSVGTGQASPLTLRERLQAGSFCFFGCPKKRSPCGQRLDEIVLARQAFFLFLDKKKQKSRLASFLE
ncbi:hypothetical protein [Pedobacter nototheniae]|uniref:hypothetical protein n=1 Tax=Pedobacter nototheniae TaxID=2488994 RepID=UPI00292FAB9E|nr:hypothetical protein [Pedobacter nototheniae]